MPPKTDVLFLYLFYLFIFCNVSWRSGVTGINAKPCYRGRGLKVILVSKGRKLAPSSLLPSEKKGNT